MWLPIILDWVIYWCELEYRHRLVGDLLQGTGKVIAHQLHHGHHELFADFRVGFGCFDDGAGITLEWDGDGVGSSYQ